jgi:hypothetical protein
MMDQLGQHGGSFNTAARYLMGAGTQTAGISFWWCLCTYLPGATEEYDGSTWTAKVQLKYSKIQVCNQQEQELKQQL